MKRTFNIATVLCILAVLSVMPVTAKTSAFKMPAYEKFKLDNGLTVYLMEHNEVPLIYVSAVIPAGAEMDGGQSGIASLTAEALSMGTKNYTKQQIDEQLDFLGASYSNGTSVEYVQLTMSFIDKDSDDVFPILKDIMVNPVFPATEIEKRKKRLLMELDQAKESPRAVIGNYYTRFIFGKHPYGNPVEGTKKTVELLKAEDLKTFYMKNYRPETSVVAIAGDFKIARMKKRIKALFEDWKAGTGGAVVKAEAVLPKFKKARVLLVDKDDATETQFMIGGLGVPRNNPDYTAIEVVNTVLGGRFTSWLNDELRVNAGLTYGAYSMFSPNKTSGFFLMSSYTKTDTTIRAVDLALEQLERLHRKGLDAKTLDSAKKYVMGQFPPRFETAGSMANLMSEMFFYQFDESYINNFEKTVAGLTLEKAHKIIKKYFPRKNLQFVFIGKSSQIRDKVKKYGKIVEKKIKADGF